MSQVQALPFDAGEVEEYIICNAGDDKQAAEFHGRKIYIPPQNEAFKPDPRRPGKALSAQDARGRYIEGTRVIVDDYDEGPGGERRLVWSARAALRYILGKDGKSELSRLGLFAVVAGVDPRSTPDWAAARRRWQENRYVRAQATIAAEQHKLALFKVSGKVPPPASPAVFEAAEILESFVPDEKMARGAFVCTACGIDRRIFGDFVRHAKAVHPEIPLPTLLQVDQDKARLTDPAYMGQTDELPTPPAPQKPAAVPTPAETEDAADAASAEGDTVVQPPPSGRSAIEAALAGGPGRKK